MPKLLLTITDPDVTSLALLVEMCDHHAIDDANSTVLVDGGLYLPEDRERHHAIQITVDTSNVYMPNIDWEDQ